MASNEMKMEPLLSFPFNAFLMVRLEYVQILQDDLQAKLLRIIEAHIETQRIVLYREAVNKQPSNSKQAISIPKDIFVPISYKLFMNDLFDLVTSENTIKKALNVLIKCKIIFKKEPPKKRYAAPSYSINTTALQILLDVLKDPGYQTLIPSIIDALKNSYPQDLIPSWYQTLIPSNSNSSSEEKSRVSEVDTNIRKKNITDKNERKPDVESPISDSLTHSSIPSLSLVDNSVDNQASSVEHPETQSPIATVTTGNASSQRNTEPLLTAEGRKIQSYWSQLGFESTSTSNPHWNTLSKHITSFEQMEGLYKYARSQLTSAKDPTVHPGNLVKAVNGWKQKQAPPDKAKEPAKVTVGNRHLQSIHSLPRL